MSGELIDDPVNAHQLASFKNFTARFLSSRQALQTAPVLSLAVTSIFP